MLHGRWVKFCQRDDRKNVTVTQAINASKMGENAGSGKIINKGLALHSGNKIFRKRRVICHPQIQFPYSHRYSSLTIYRAWKVG